MLSQLRIPGINPYIRVYVCLGIREMIAVIQGWEGGTRNILLLQGTCITHEAIQCYFKVYLNQSQIYIADSRTNTKKTTKSTTSKTETKKVTKEPVKTNTKTIKNLKAKKKYWVQVRTYKNVNGKTYYSAWSAKKSITTK